MPDFLTFALYAPIASFGAPAVGERRGSFERPTRSQVLGLIGACLGLDRADDDGQAALAAGYGLAIRAEAPGRLLPDYHTAQMPPTRRGRRFSTRAAELAADDLATVLSRRDYRSDAWHLAAIWIEDDARWSLAELAAAMRRPVFTLSLGRKSCPLGLPLAPALVEAGDPVAALGMRAADGPERAFRTSLLRSDPPSGVVVAMDENQWSGGHSVLRTEMRRDAPLSRRRWQFALRREIVVAVS